MNDTNTVAVAELKISMMTMVLKKDAAYHPMINKLAKALFDLTGEVFSNGSFIKI